MERFIEKLFLQVLNMSLTASYVILIVVAVRFLLKRMPKIYSYALWGVVFFRLLFPFSFSSVYSLLTPFRSEQGDYTYIPMNIGIMDKPKIDIGINSISHTINASLPVATKVTSVNPIQVWLLILSVIWLLGVLAWIMYSIFSYARIRNKVSTAIKLQDNIYECTGLKTPFILAIIKPRIYLPLDLNENERSYILKHEQIHIKRLDYIIKPIAYFAFCIHWFNPLVWISFKLMNRDMEMSCDEQVVNELGKDIKKAYSQSLLSLSVRKVGGVMAPLAFGESNTKIRIKNLLNYRKPKFWVSLILVLLCGGIGLGLVANPKEDSQDLSLLNSNYQDMSSKIMTKSYFETNKVNSVDESDNQKTIGTSVESSLNIIMSSPKEASNPGEYINMHQSEYENIIKCGEPALIYMLSEFQKGNQTGLKGAIMKELCKEILGNRIQQDNNTYSNAQEWYNQLVIQQEVILPAFTIQKADKIEQLTYDAAIIKYPSYPKDGHRGLCIVAPKIYDLSEEGNKLRIFAIVYHENYRFYGNRLVQKGGSIVPTAITYTKDSKGNYSLEEYIESRDGGMFADSIEAFCVKPISGEKIKGLAQKIIGDSDYSELFEVEKENLKNYLIEHQLKDVKVFDVLGNLISVVK